MKRNILFIMLLTLLLPAASCSREFIPGAEGDSILLISSVAQDGQELSTRALTPEELTDANYQENVINRLDVFFFDGFLCWLLECFALLLDFPPSMFSLLSEDDSLSEDSLSNCSIGILFCEA